MDTTRALRSVAAVLGLVLAACGSSDPLTLNDEGIAALTRGDSRGALAKFDAVLAQQGVHPDQRFRAAFKRSEALTHIDPARARDAFLDLARTERAEVLEDDYSYICSKLLAVGATMEAIDVMDAGSKHYAGSPKMAAIQQAVKSAAQRESSPAALEKLKGLGYAGD